MVRQLVGHRTVTTHRAPYAELPRRNDQTRGSGPAYDVPASTRDEKPLWFVERMRPLQHWRQRTERRDHGETPARNTATASFWLHRTFFCPYQRRGLVDASALLRSACPQPRTPTLEGPLSDVFFVHLLVSPRQWNGRVIKHAREASLLFQQDDPEEEACEVAFKFVWVMSMILSAVEQYR
jgi:hypothetical protein